MQRLKIGSRLALSFGIILLLLFLGTAVGLWQLNTIQMQAQRLHQADTQAAAALRVHNSVLALKDELEQLALTRRDAPFAEAAIQLRDSFIKNVDNAIANFGPPPRNAEQIRQLQSIKVSVSTQVDALISLAQANAWVLLELRLNDEMQEVSRTTQTLVEEITAAETIEQQTALERMSQVQRQALITIIVVSLLMLLAAGTLGFVVTRSIAQPLAHL